MSVPHHKFVGRMPGDKAFHSTPRRHRTRRKHNGRLRALPHMGMLKQKQRKDMNRLDWLLQMSRADAILWYVERAYREHPR